MIAQPEEDEQSVSLPTVPDMVADYDDEQPDSECKAIWLFVMRLTPSMMSISPPYGQFRPFVQNAGHTYASKQK